jgi:hypothetical protein
VGSRAFVVSDTLLDDRRAGFAAEYARVVDAFRSGREVEVLLRFWPTWPSKGRFAARFSLMGFSKALEELSQCR